MKIKDDFEHIVVCENCGYQNKEYNAIKFATCTGCRKPLDDKTQFKHQMYRKLRTFTKEYRDSVYNSKTNEEQR